MNAQRSATLVVFTLGPGRESVRRRWLSNRGAGQEKQLHESCLDALLSAGLRAGCDLRLSTPAAMAPRMGVTFDRQVESGFRNRFVGAIERAERVTEGPLVVVGTDCPDVSESLMTTALDRLRKDEREVVVGPAADGGIYLLATAQPVSGLLSQIPWRTRRALPALLTALRGAGLAVHLLPVLSDLDSQQEFESWLAQGARASTGMGAGAIRRCAAHLVRLVQSGAWVMDSPPTPLAEQGRSALADRAPPTA